jgi:hypothetical protein
MIGRVWEALWHRWYITVPSLVLAALLAGAAWMLVPPMYERTASQLLVPGAGTVPARGNPYFYLSGLTQAADVIVRAVGSENVVHEIDSSFTGVEIEVTRDPSTAGPVILIIVDAPSDADAAAVLTILVQRTKVVLEDLQASDSVAPSDRILVQSISIDKQGILRQRNRIVATAAVGAIVAILGLLVAALVDGLSARRRRRRRLGDPVTTDSNGDAPNDRDLEAQPPDNEGADEVEPRPEEPGVAPVTDPVGPVADAAEGDRPERPVGTRRGVKGKRRQPGSAAAPTQSDAADGDGVLDTPVGAGRA